MRMGTATLSSSRNNKRDTQGTNVDLRMKLKLDGETSVQRLTKDQFPL